MTLFYVLAQYFSMEQKYDFMYHFMNPPGNIFSQKFTSEFYE